MSETTDQMALFDFLTRMEERHPLLAYAFHVPNGEKRDKATAAKLKAMGVKPGVWDIWLPVHNRVEVGPHRPGFFVGLVIELKSSTGAESPEQLEWRHTLTKEGWMCCVYREWTEAARRLLQWVGGNPDDVVGL